jgi:hypothetical protein
MVCRYLCIFDIRTERFTLCILSSPGINIPKRIVVSISSCFPDIDTFLARSAADKKSIHTKGSRVGAKTRVKTYASLP